MLTFTANGYGQNSRRENGAKKRPPLLGQPQSESLWPMFFLLITDFGGGAPECPGELGGGSALLMASAIAPEDHPGERHAGGRALAPRRAGAEDDLHPLLAAGV